MSIIAAGNTTTTALVQTADTTGNLVFTTGGANTTALTISNTQNATFANSVTITGTTTQTGNASFSNVSTTGSIGVGTSSPGAKLDVVGNVLLSGQSTADQFIRIGSGRTGNGYSYLDIQGDTTYAAGLRLIRLNSGANSASSVEHSGTGALQLVTQQAAPIDFYTSATQRMRVTAGGELLVGQTSVSVAAKSAFTTTGNDVGNVTMRNSNNTAGKWYAVGATADVSPYFVVYNESGIGCYISPGGNTWTSGSDENTKDIIEPISDAVNKVSSLRSVIGKYKTDEEGTRRSFLIAQDVQKVLPEAVTTSPEGTLGLQYQDIIPLLVAAVKELKAELDQTKAEIAALKAGK